MHFGTNDCWSNRATSTILAANTTLVNQMRANNPNMKILVTQIIPMDPNQSCSICDQNVINLNNTIPGWANNLTTTQSPIYVVDQWTGFSYTTDTYDGVHPNDSGDLKISNKWYDTLAPLLSGSSVTPAPTTTPGLLGDVDSDGEIDILDALLIAQ
jgi:lysophospholipase L1-like esterase